MISETPNTTIQAVASISVVVIFMVLLVTIIILIVVGLLLLNRRSKTQGHHHNSFYPNLLYYNNQGLPMTQNIITLSVSGIRLTLSLSGDVIQSTSYKVDSNGDYDVVQDELCIEQSCDKHMNNSAAIDLTKSNCYYSTLTQKQPQEEQTSTSNVCIMYK